MPGSRDGVKAIGLTGNLGSGKSTVARQLAARGAAVLDADRLVHGMLAPGGEAVSSVLAAFPEAADASGLAVDRKALAARVFTDQAARRQLEGILHPLVIARQGEWLEAMRTRGERLAVVEATLFLEAWKAGGPDPRDRFDLIVVVTCDPEVQVRRAVARALASGAASAADAERDARARLAAQMPQDEKAALADIVIDNSGSAAETDLQVGVLVSKLIGPATST